MTTVQTTEAVVLSQPTPQVEAAIVTWLYVKKGRTGSANTLEAYARTMRGFREALQRVGLDVDGNTRAVALAAQAWASRDVRGMREVAPSTYNQRLATLSSFYTFARKRGLLTVENPIALVDRKPVQEYAGARALNSRTVAAALGRIRLGDLAGRRDYALLAVALHTGRRASELAGLRAGDVQVEGSAVVLTWRRCKGGKQMVDRLPSAVAGAFLRYVRGVHGDDLAALPADAPIWVSCSRNRSKGQAIGTQAFADICQKRLGTTQVHALRHTFAHAMEDAGAKVSDIQARLGHASLAVTGRYLAALRSDVNPHGDNLARLFGVE